MGRAVLLACVPWLGWLLVSFAALLLLTRVGRARLELGRLRHLHADERGSAQSLSFVLTLPLFVMILLLIVQVSQLMIGTVVVHYTACAAARAAAVWIPADLSPKDPREGANCISSYSIDPAASAPAGGMTYIVAPSGAKYEKFRAAAVAACMPIAPSRDLGTTLPAPAAASADSMETAYGALTSAASTGTKLPERMRNKLAYAMANTAVTIRFFHGDQDPAANPLGVDFSSNRLGTYFQCNEVGWRDPITVTVTHHLALLPGPGRLLARHLVGPAGTADELSAKIGGHQGQAGNVYTDVYTYDLSAAAMIGNEGERSVMPHAY
jgi:hypothetical protein